MLEECRRLEKSHPSWRVWKSDGGTWWAAYAGGKWSVDRENHGCMAHLNAESAQELGKKLAKSEACERCWGPA